MRCVSDFGLSLNESYDLTWAEFCILSFAYDRKRRREIEDLRLICYMNLLANWQSKKPVPSIDKYMPIGDAETKNASISDKIRERFFEVSKDYYDKINKKDG